MMREFLQIRIEADVHACPKVANLQGVLIDKFPRGRTHNLNKHQGQGKKKDHTTQHKFQPTQQGIRMIDVGTVVIGTRGSCLCFWIACFCFCTTTGRRLRRNCGR
mmetsp:Transcript_10505/g.12002  ORF Transcript_10505/g.12002 Transcript_10505/m.12002 type:complete len:105 (-) Transcript_10505:676-990(-)